MNLAEVLGRISVRQKSGMEKLAIMVIKKDAIITEG